MTNEIEPVNPIIVWRVRFEAKDGRMTTVFVPVLADVNATILETVALRSHCPDWIGKNFVTVTGALFREQREKLSCRMDVECDASELQPDAKLAAAIVDSQPETPQARVSFCHNLPGQLCLLAFTLQSGEQVKLRIPTADVKILRDHLTRCVDKSAQAELARLQMELDRYVLEKIQPRVVDSRRGTDRTAVDSAGNCRPLAGASHPAGAGEINDSPAPGSAQRRLGHQGEHDDGPDRGQRQNAIGL